MTTFVFHFFVIPIVSNVVLRAFAEDSETNFKILQKQVFSECSEEHPVENYVIKDIANNIHIPDDNNAKCWLSCVLKKMGVMREGWSIDWETCRIQTKLTLTNEEDKAKVDKLADCCKAEVSEEEANECDLAYTASKCKFEHWKKYGLPQNTWSE